MSLRPIDPVCLTTTDGQERKLLLSRGAIKRAKERTRARTLQELLDKVSRDEDDAASILIYESLLDRTITEDEFDQICPFFSSIELIAQLLNVSMPETNGTRPTQPLAPNTTEAEIGS